jgi:heme-NO-binding protein
MHGIIFSELKRFVEESVGNGKWPVLLHEAGLARRTYLPTQEYPDAEAFALVAAACRITRLPAATLLESFGTFMVPDLVRLYGSLIDPTWRTLDVLEHTEAAIHRVVRLRNPGAKPPELVCRRERPDEVTIFYRSARKMCGVAIGIVHGLARHYAEDVAVQHGPCMNDGADECVIRVRLSAGA